MFQFGKRKRYSIGEKIAYFEKIKKDKTASKKKKDWADLRLSNLKKQKDNMKLGDIFITHDNLVAKKKNSGATGKPRVVVVAKTSKNNSVFVIPVRYDNKLMSLSQFDGNRSVSFNNVVEINKNKLYQKRGFKFKKMYLTPTEKVRLNRKSETYFK